MSNNKYSLIIPNDILKDYYNSLINSTYKLLPLWEGQDLHTKQIIYSREEAQENFEKYLQNLIYEIAGMNYLFDKDYSMLKLLNCFQGMLEIKQNEHKKLKSLVFHCISICKKLKEGVDNDT